MSLDQAVGAFVPVPETFKLAHLHSIARFLLVCMLEHAATALFHVHKLELEV